MKTILSFLICLLTANISLHAQAVESEPNDAPFQADKMPLNGSGSGAMSPAGNIDWWKVTTNADGKLAITLNNTGNQDIKYINLYDTGGIVLLQNAGIGNGIGGLTQDGLAVGTYYIKIEGQFDNETGNYVLSNTFTPANKPNDKEPNNLISKALRLPLNDSVTGHLGYYYFGRRDTTDWYKVTTIADGKLDITFDNTYQNDAKTVILFDTTGNPQLATANVGNGVGGLSYDGLAAGTYYIEITGGYAGSYNDFGPYTLKDSLEVSPKPNDKEPNNIISKAKKLNLNDSTTGHLGYYYNHVRDTIDWYKVTTNTDGKLDITFDNTNQFGVKTITLFDTTGSPQLAGANIGNGRGSFNYDGLAAGTYYIEITGGYSGEYNDFGVYTLKDSLETYKYAAEKEPNNHAYQAVTLPTDTTTTGHVNFYYNHKTDTADWYRLTYMGSGKISFTVKIEPSLLNGTIDAIYMDAYKDTLQAPVYSQACFSATNTFKFAKGKYYIKVYPYFLSTGPSSYSIKVSIPQAGNFNDAAPVVSSAQQDKFIWSIAGNASQNNCLVKLKLNSTANISIQVTSLNGNPVQLINKGTLAKGNYDIPLNFSNAIAGMYIVNIIADDQIDSKKIIK